jgi:SPP1 family predicted phage head-tail adaptor
VKAGRLRHRVRIEELVAEIPDSDEESGARVESWVDAFDMLIPAEIAPLSGRELVAAAQVQSKVAARIRIRHRPGVSANMRVNHRGTYYGIEAVTTDQGSGVEYMTLHCTDGANQG